MPEQFPEGVYYFLVPKEGDRVCEKQDCRFCRYFDTLGVELRIVIDRIIYDCCWLEAFKTKNIAQDESKKLLRHFLTETLGQPLSVPVPHQLLNNHVYQQWIDAHGETREIFGKIVGCFEEDEGKTKELLFDVEYDSDRHPERMGNAPMKGQLRESFAAGAAAAFQRKISEVTGPSSSDMQVEKPFASWIVPVRRKLPAQDQAALPKIVLSVGGFVLTLEAAESQIPGAGLGLWLSCTEQVVLGRKHFELPAGCFIDLGVYAPLVSSHRTKEHVLFVKSFLHSFKPDTWSFAAPTGVGNVVYGTSRLVRGDIRLC